MDRSSPELHVRIDQIERLLMFDYEPGTDDALFDICDNQGRIVKTFVGNIDEAALHGLIEKLLA